MSAKNRKAAAPQSAYPAERGAALALSAGPGGVMVFWQPTLRDLLRLVNRWAGSDCIGPEVSIFVAERGRWVTA